jgi:hypothetical protein
MQTVDYSQELDVVLAHLESSGDGLGAEPAADRLSRFGANDLFRTALFPVARWPYILACFLPSFIAIEVLKVWQRRRR